MTTAFDVRRAVLVGLTATVVVAAAGFWSWQRMGDVPRGTRVLGVDLGGLSRAEAESRLSERLVGRAPGPALIRLDGRDERLDPAAIGLSIDVSGSVDQAIQAGRHVAPVVRVDRVRLEAVLRARLRPGRVTMRKPGITFRGLRPEPSYPEPGLDLDPAVAVRAVEAAWPAGGVAEVPLVRRVPVTTAAEVDALVAGVARPAVAAPVTVRVGRRMLKLCPYSIGRGLIFKSDDAGRLTPAIDGVRLHAAAEPEFRRVEIPPRPARIALAGGRPRIVASTAGELVDRYRLGRALLTVLPRAAPRVVTAVLRRAEPGTTDAELAGLGVRERVSTFTTHFSGGRNSPRSRNIATIAAEVDGAMVRPGEIFSLNAHTGARDYAAGYQDAPVIIGGRLEPGVGGGASQFTTTLFNAAYYAGLQDVEHKPHSFYFDRYPAVIESTIFYPDLDLKFRNTTPYGILIDTVTSGRSVTVALWSTRVYDKVTTEYGPRRQATAPPTVVRPAGPKCITSSGLPGFTQDAWRVIRKDGREVERRKFTWRYDPEPRFLCGDEP